MVPDMSSVQQDTHALSSYWRPFRYFNLFRLVVAVSLLASYFFRRQYPSWPIQDNDLYLTVVSNYVAFSIVVATIGTVAVSAASRPWPHYNIRLTLLVLGDIVFITLLMHASGGVRSGFGLLLIVAIAAATLVSEGRQALLYAGFATIGVLLEQSYHLLTAHNYEGYSHALLLSASFFATTGLAHYFANRTRASEELATQRGEDLENLETINQLVIRDMPDGVLVVDKDARLRYLNSQAEHLLGELAQGWQAGDIDSTVNPVVQQLQRWLESGQDRSSVVVVKIGTREVRLRFLAISADRKHGAVVFIEDWSRVQKQAQQIKLVALGRLTASIAHEIRNPLSAIGHASQLLLEDEQIDPTTTRLLQIIQDNVQRLDSIVQDVMQLNRRDRAQIAPLPVSPFLHEFREHFCQVENIPFEGLTLEFVASETGMPLSEATEVAFDRHQLHQILWNLCRNGWRHGRKQTGSVCIRVALSEDGLGVLLDVMDDGPGIAEDVLPRLFEPFFTTESSGTGLGLYIARELCAANDAQIDYVQSEHGGQFRIYAKKYDG